MNLSLRKPFITSIYIVAVLLIGNLHPITARTAFIRNVGSELLRVPTYSSVSAVLDLRGGAKRRRKTKTSVSSRTTTGKKKVGAAAEKEQKSAVNDTLQKYKKILPLTRIHITLVGVVTLLGIILGEELTQSLLALDPMQLIYGMQLWRIFSAASFLGKPSVGWLMQGYYLFEYGSSLERAYGSAQHLMFVITQLLLLTVLSILLGQPFFANSMITAMLHVLSRAAPKQKVKWLIFNVPYWSLPYGLLATDVLSGQQGANPMAALPHIIGILSGHFYHFNKNIWPRMGGEDWLAAPDFVVQRLDPNANKDSAKENISKALKSRKRGKGRKLGGG